MSEFQASNFKKENGGTPDLLGKTELTSPYFFVPPSGDTASRPESCAPGTLRFNTDIGTLEVYRGDTIGWHQILKRDAQYLGGNSSNSTGSQGGNSTTASLGARGVFFGGSPSSSNVIQFIMISTTGNSLDFGDMAGARVQGAAAGSRTRGLYAGGEAPSIVNTIEFITFSSTGDAQNFGDMVTNQYRRMNGMGCGNQTRALFSGGYTGSATSNHIDYVTIAQTGNSVDFGDLTVARESGSQCASTTRGIIFGGRNQPANAALNSIDFVTIMTTGNATDFGDLTVTRFATQSCSNPIRGLTFGGSSIPASKNEIDYITIPTLGNAVDFGDILTAVQYPLGAVASPTRAVCAGGLTPNQNVIQSVEIMTTGNAIDFGDLLAVKGEAGGCSNGHGGL